MSRNAATESGGSSEVLPLEGIDCRHHAALVELRLGVSLGGAKKKVEDEQDKKQGIVQFG